MFRRGPLVCSGGGHWTLLESRGVFSKTGKKKVEEFTFWHQREAPLRTAFSMPPFWMIVVVVRMVMMMVVVVV